MASATTRATIPRSPSARLRVPLTTFKLWARYFRFETEGFEVVANSEPSLLVGYHGGPWTFDLWMLAARMYDELGYFPRAFWHRIWWRFPALREAVTELGGLPGPPTHADMAEMRSRGEHMVVAPGGTREALRPFWRSHRVDFGGRRGYLRLARAHDLPIIPVVATGLDETFLGLSDGYVLPKLGVPVYLGLGLGGVWPFAPPFPVKIRQRVGDPIRLGSPSDGDEGLEEVNARVATTLQAMLDALRRDHPGRLHVAR
jgi:1-acyl-sn-glycerol-3-phosphate acyltransferase